jgi:hypothetical protein
MIKRATIITTILLLIGVIAIGIARANTRAARRPANDLRDHATLQLRDVRLYQDLTGLRPLAARLTLNTRLSAARTVHAPLLPVALSSVLQRDVKLNEAKTALLREYDVAAVVREDVRDLRTQSALLDHPLGDLNEFVHLDVAFVPDLRAVVALSNHDSLSNAERTDVVRLVDVERTPVDLLTHVRLDSCATELRAGRELRLSDRLEAKLTALRVGRAGDLGLRELNG